VPPNAGLVLIGQLTTSNVATGLPYGVQVLNGQVFFSNGSTTVKYSDGSNTIKVAGNAPGSCRFLTTLGQRLVGAYWTEPSPGQPSSLTFPNRVRWSAVNNPLQWDPTVNGTAGFNDLIDVPDVITGLVTIGQNAYITRTNGVTVMSPTGPLGSPFSFFNESIAPQGVGNLFAYSLSSFGIWCAFVSEDDVYLFDGVNFIPIGGASRKKIFFDLSGSQGDVITGWVTPQLHMTYPYLSYWLSIPGTPVSGSIVWVYSRLTNKWQRFFSGKGSLSTLAVAAVQ